MRAIEGQIRVGEANAACGRIQRSRVGLPWYLIAVAIIPLMAFGFGVIDQFLYHAGLSPWGRLPVGEIGGLILGIIVYVQVCRRLGVRQFKDQFRRRGLPIDMTTKVEVTPEHLSQKLEGFTQQAEWRSVTELFKVRGYWIFMAMSAAIVVPRRFFPDPAEERSFISEAVSHMSPEARARSREAVAFVAG